jgi:hypothetical protein
MTSSVSAAHNETTLQSFSTDTAVYFGVVVVAICLLPAAFFFSCRVGRRFRLSRHHRHVATTVATTPEDSQSSSAPDRVLAIRLDHAEAARKSLRVRVSATFWQMGWTILVLGLAPLTYEIFTVDVRAPIVGHFFYYASATPWGTALIVLTLRPTDATHIRYTCLFFSGACAIFGPQTGFMAAAGSHYGFNPIHRVALLILSLLAVLGVVLLWPNLDVCRCSAQPKSPRSKLLRLWLTGRLLFGGGAICFFIQFLAPFYDGQFTAPTGGVDDAQSARLVMSAACLAVTVMCTPANRGRVVRWLSALQERNIILGAGDSSMQEAAAVAALLGDQTVGNALAYALKGFRALPLAVLTPEDLKEKEPAAAKHGQRVRWEERSQEAEELRMLSLKTVTATLGSVDAFISHSWSDEGRPKFNLLCEWAGSELDRKRIWLDKACIDQTDVAKSLACLPIFLFGCRQLLVLAGPKYATRLWCAMEIFVFVRMGGKHEDIVVKLLDSDSSLAKNLQEFDAHKAKCSETMDQHTLWAVIESAFGDLVPFNKIVREIFAAPEVSV